MSLVASLAVVAATGLLPTPVLARGESVVLPEESKLSAREELVTILLEFYTPEVPDALGWSERTVESAVHDGAGVYFVTDSSERVELESLGIVAVTEHSLWSEDLELLRLRVERRALGSEAELKEWAWTQGQLTSTDLSERKPRAEPSGDVRPTVDAWILAALGTTPAGQRAELRTLDRMTGAIQEAEFFGDREVEITHLGARVQAQRFTERAGESYTYHYLADGGWVGSAIDGRSEAWRTADRVREQLAWEVRFSSELTRVLHSRAREEWELKSGRWRNEFLGCTFKIDKNWVRPDEVPEHLSLMLASPGGDEALYLTAEFAALEDGELELDLEEFADTKAETFVAGGIILEDEVARGSTKVSKRTVPSRAFRDADTGLRYRGWFFADRNVVYSVWTMRDGGTPERAEQAVKSFKPIRIERR